MVTNKYRDYVNYYCGKSPWEHGCVMDDKTGTQLIISSGNAFYSLDFQNTDLKDKLYKIYQKHLGDLENQKYRNKPQNLSF